MADVATVAPVYQLIGTIATVVGGVVVAYIARGGSKKKPDASVRTEVTGIHTDIILLTEAVSGLKVLLLDYWQWSRDRENTARERHEWLKENLK